MNKTKYFKANHETSLHGFRSGFSQFATESGLSHHDFGKTPGNTFKHQSNIELFLLNNLYIIESHIYSETKGTVNIPPALTFRELDEAQKAFKQLKKQYRLKLVVQPQSLAEKEKIAA